MSKETERYTAVLLEWMTSLSHEAMVKTEQKLKIMLIELNEHHSAHVERQLTSIVNRLSYMTNLQQFDSNQFYLLMQKWISQESLEHLPFFCQLVVILPRIFQNRIEKIQQTQNEVIRSFLNWTKNRKSSILDNSIRSALIELRHNIEQANDPDELTSFIYFAIMPAVEKIVPLLDDDLDINAVILDFEALGNTWYEAIYNYTAPVDSSSESARQEQIQLAYHYTVYTIFFESLRSKMPLNTDISSILQDMLEKKQLLNTRIKQCNEQMIQTSEAIQQEHDTSMQTHLQKKQQYERYSHGVLGNTIAALEWLNRFLSTRHNFDLKHGLIEAQQQQKRFNEIYESFYKREISNEFSFERCLQHDCLIEFGKLIALLDYFVDKIKSRIENAIPMFKQCIHEHISTILKSKPNKGVIEYLNKLEKQVDQMESISDIYEFKQDMSKKISDFLNKKTIAPHFSQRLFNSSLSIDFRSTLADSSWDRVKSLLLFINDLLPEIIDDETQQDASEKAKTRDRLGIRTSQIFATPPRSVTPSASENHTRDSEEVLQYALSHSHLLAFRDTDLLSDFDTDIGMNEDSYLNHVDLGIGK